MILEQMLMVSIKCRFLDAFLVCVHTSRNHTGCVYRVLEIRWHDGDNMTDWEVNLSERTRQTRRRTWHEEVLTRQCGRWRAGDSTTVWEVNTTRQNGRWVTLVKKNAESPMATWQNTTDLWVTWSREHDRPQKTWQSTKSCEVTWYRKHDRRGIYKPEHDRMSRQETLQTEGSNTLWYTVSRMTGSWRVVLARTTRTAYTRPRNSPLPISTLPITSQPQTRVFLFPYHQLETSNCETSFHQSKLSSLIRQY